MGQGGRLRTLAVAFAVATGVAFVWVTIKALRADPDNLLLMLWMLSFVASIGTSGKAIHMCMRPGGVRPATRMRADTDALVSTVDEGLVLYSVD